MNAWTRALLLTAAFALAPAARACVWSAIDERVDRNESGIWEPNAYRGLVALLTLGEIGDAVYEGAETRWGKTLWQGIDAQLFSFVGAEAGKFAFSRSRPSSGDNPCHWFEGGGADSSFPSAEAAVAAGLVAPYVLEYGREHPAVLLLTLVPLYVGVARIKNQEHWQTDVLAGWTIGGLAGWYAHGRETPLTIECLPHGVAVGWRKPI